ncbi:MAG: hypothetical protein JKY54_15245 [Flavobacteriales bacterium]|nr:hypothetical protein [Flavobacteriales bacterium]
MHSRLLKYSWIFLLGFLWSCQDEPETINALIVDELFSEPDPLNTSALDISWLEGNWRDSTSWAHLDAQIVERWYLADQIFYGTGLQVKNGTDTTLVESLQIKLTTNPINFAATVKNQNGGKAINFELKAYSSDSVRFENMAHSFPQVIIYKRITADSIHATAAAYTPEGILRKQTSKLSRY